MTEDERKNWEGLVAICNGETGLSQLDPSVIAAVAAHLAELERQLCRARGYRRAKYIGASDDLEEGHCKDCCCARTWAALGVIEYDGKSIPEHIASLKSRLEREETMLKRVGAIICDRECVETVDGESHHSSLCYDIWQTLRAHGGKGE